MNIFLLWKSQFILNIFTLLPIGEIEIVYQSKSPKIRLNWFSFEIRSDDSLIWVNTLLVLVYH